MKKLNQSRMAEIAGISRPYLCNLLNGKKRMGPAVARALSRATRIEAKEIIFAAPEELDSMLASALDADN